MGISFGPGFAGGLAQGLGALPGVIAQQRSQKRQEEAARLQAEIQKEELGLRIRQEKIKLDQLKFARDQATKKDEFRQRFFQVLSSGEEETGSGPPPPNMGPFTPAREPQEVRAEQFRIPLPTLVGGPEELAGQAVLTPPPQLPRAATPAASRPRSRAMSRQNFFNLQRLANDSGMGNQLKLAIDSGFIQTPQSLIEERKEQQKLLEGDQRQNVLSHFQGLALEGGPAAGEAGKVAMLMQLGRDKEAAEIAYPELRNLSDNQVRRMAVQGDPEAIKMLILKRDERADENFLIESGVDSNGNPQTFVSKGGKRKVSQRVLQGQLDEFARFESAEIVLGELDRVLKENPGSVGFASNMNQLITKLQTQLAGVALDGPIARTVQDALFGLDAQAASSVETLGIVASAMVLRGVLEEKGQTTDRDMRNGQDALGFSRNFFNISSAPDIRNKIKTQLGLVAKRKQAVRERSALIEDLTGKDSAPPSFLQQLATESGIELSQGSSAQTRQPSTRRSAPTRTLSDIDAELAEIERQLQAVGAGAR